MAIVSFFPVTEEVLAVGAINQSSKERKRLAQKSTSWKCPQCKRTNEEIAAEFLKPLTDEAAEAAEGFNVNFESDEQVRESQESDVPYESNA